MRIRIRKELRAVSDGHRPGHQGGLGNEVSSSTSRVPVCFAVVALFLTLWRGDSNPGSATTGKRAMTPRRVVTLLLATRSGHCAGSLAVIERQTARPTTAGDPVAAGTRQARGQLRVRTRLTEGRRHTGPP